MSSLFKFSCSYDSSIEHNELYMLLGPIFLFKFLLYLLSLAIPTYEGLAGWAPPTKICLLRPVLGVLTLIFFGWPYYSYSVASVHFSTTLFLRGFYLLLSLKLNFSFKNYRTSSFRPCYFFSFMACMPILTCCHSIFRFYSSGLHCLLYF